MHRRLERVAPPKLPCPVATKCTIISFPLLVHCRGIWTARFVDLMEEYMKPLVVEYPEELPGLLKMTEEQFAAEVRFLAAAKLFELGKLSSRPQPWPDLDGWRFSISLANMASVPSICMMNRSKPNSAPPPILLHEH